MAAYPGEGNRMSNYGLKVPSPEELKLLWIEYVGVSIIGIIMIINLEDLCLI